MSDLKGTVLRLHPAPREELALQGLYLGLNLHRQSSPNDMLIYSNYIASLDGRISLKDAKTGEFGVPETLANKRDWRLYQELASQSDVMITSARYFRQLAKGHAQGLLPVGNEPEYADLLDWRRGQGLASQPDVAVLSRSLDIPPEALDKITERKVAVMTSEQADEKKAAALEAHGATVLAAGRETVDGGSLKAALMERGYRSAYMIAGPEVHHTLIAAHCIDRLFLTQRHSLLGGREFRTMVSSDMPAPARAALVSMFLDSGITPQQTYAQYAFIGNSE